MWYAFRTEPQKEFAAQEIVNRHGYRAIVPYEWRMVRRSRHVKKKTYNVYQHLIGYVFVEFKHPPNWYEMFSMRCLKSVVGFGGVPMPIPQAGIDRLVSLTNMHVPHVHSRNTRRASFMPGDTARIADGPFKGLEGRVEAVKGKHARMAFEMLGCVREVDVPIETMEAA